MPQSNGSSVLHPTGVRQQTTANICGCRRRRPEISAMSERVTARVGFMKHIISAPSSSSSSSSSEGAAEEDDDDGCHYVTTTSSSNTIQHREPRTLGSLRRSGTHLGLPSPPLPHTLASSLVAFTACNVSERLSNGHELQLGPR
jgi:hypothetical protein